MLIGKVLSPSLPDAEKLSTYECGFEPFEDARMQFDIRYYLVAILFILFDLEIAFLFPWAVAFKDLDFFGLMSMMIFFSEKHGNKLNPKMVTISEALKPRNFLKIDVRSKIAKPI